MAWHPLGWRAAWFAEVDRAASEVLAYRFPDVANHGDMTLLAGMIRRREIPAPDALVGGTPCQAFSVAGMRRGLDDERGQLTLAYVDLANAIDEVRAAGGLAPVIIVWENVPGVLTSKDNAFGCFLAGIAGEDDPLVPAGKKWTNAGAVCGPERAIAWRTLDAQWFGLAQRRRRVFVVASAREGFDPAEILLEFDGVRRDSAPSREAGEGAAGTADASTDSGCFPGTDEACSGYLQPVDGRLREPAELVPTWWDGRDVSQTLDAVLYKGQTMPEKNRFPAVLQPVAYSVALRGREGGGTAELGDDVAGCLRASGGGGDKPHVLTFYPTNRQPENGIYEDVSPAVKVGSGGGSGNPPAVCITGDVTHTLKAEGFDASEDGTGRGQPIVAFDTYNQAISDVTHTLRNPNGTFGDALPATFDGMAVRRLMPVECERLQGFPSNWTLVPTGKNGKPAADGPRYKQLGNSMAVNVMHWIGRRIADHLRRDDDEFDSLIGHNGGPAIDEFEALL